MPKEQVTRFLLVARSLVYNEIWKMPAVMEPRHCSEGVRAFHCTQPGRGAFLFTLRKVKSATFKLRDSWVSTNPRWSIRDIVELTREEYLSVLDDYVHTTQR